MKMETYSVCNSPEDSCAAPERLSPRNSTSLCTYSDVKTSVIRPSPTFARSECIPVTTTAYKNLSQLSECTMITATTTVTTERSPNPQHKEVSQTKAVDTDTITKTLSATPPILCSCSKSVNSLQLRMNESLSTANQTLPSALGALLGIAVVALVVTTMGWVWTCWRLKKSGGIKINSDEQER